MRSLLPLLFLSVCCTCVLAQKPVNFGQFYELRSEVLDEDRQINVLLPTEYADSTNKKYPVIYLLDGATDEDFFHVSGLLRYFDDHQMMPPAILVGIANVDRKRDFTYPSKDPRDVRDFPTTGGSAKFIEFLQRELPAFVNKTFRTTEHKTLIGQSLGGLLTTEILLKHPGYFNDYIIVSPSLWWDKEQLYTDMDSLVTALDAYPERLFVSVGEEYPVMVDGSRRLVRLLHPHTKATFFPLMDEDHNTILHEALYRAFDGWYDPTVLHPYHFANAWNGLNMRSGPSLDSAVVGKLAYGAGLGIIKAQEEETVIDGLKGRWTYIGSDIGRGWVFDAFVSPVRVFRSGQTIKEYADENLDLTDSLFYSMPGFETSASYMEIHSDDKGNKYTFHQMYEAASLELKIANLTGAQAMNMATNWMLSKGYNFKDTKNGFKDVTGEMWINHTLKPEPDGMYLTIYYDPFGKELTILRTSDGPW